MCTKYQPSQSILTGNQSLDVQLQMNLIEILKSLNTNYELEIIIVMSGLKPPQLVEDTSSLVNSYHLWSSSKEDKKLFEQICKRYGA